MKIQYDAPIFLNGHEGRYKNNNAYGLSIKTCNINVKVKNGGI